MISADFLEVLQDATFELPNLLKAFTLHEWGCFFTADTARTESHDGLLLELFRQISHGFWKVAELIHANHRRTFEGAQLHLVIIAGIQQRHRSAFIQPLFQCFGFDSWRGVFSRLNPFDTKSDDLLLDADQHAIEWLVLAVTVFRCQTF